MSPLHELSEFGNLDRTSAPEDYVRYLDAISSLDSVRTYKERSFELLRVQSGDRILDVGCGTGEDVQRLAERTGATGIVIGIDKSEVMIAEAKKRSDGLSLSVDYRVDNLLSLHFSDNSFDGCRADRVLQHVEEPQRAVQELARVVRSKGRVVVSDTDFETLIVDTTNRPLTRRILNFHCDHVRNGWIGRRLGALLWQTGLTGINISAETLVFTQPDLADVALGFTRAALRAYESDLISAEETAEWLNMLQQSAGEGRFFSAITGFVAVGIKP
jgi:ubiquinone/menaquinone biosynthesis C-methylase UbiE